MPIARSYPTSSTTIHSRLIILWIMTTVVLGGCAATPAREPVSPVYAQKKVSDGGARTAAAAELGSDIAEKLPEVSSPAPQPKDSGAERLVRSLNESLGDERFEQLNGVVRIGVYKLRNHSRCRQEEFQSLLERVAELLTHAGRESGLAFTSDEAIEVDYHLKGTAYLITADGFDLWEVFPTLSPAYNKWTLWQAPGPVRMLRQKRPDQQQMFLSQNW